ncbi:hypothetical protein CEXT_445621, partial [Caerostris extrusa]
MGSSGSGVGFPSPEPKGQLPLHIVCSRPTGQALTPLQLLLKATGKDARLLKDK